MFGYRTLGFGSGVSADDAFDIPNSVRFEDGDSPYLSITPGSAGNRKTWTFSAWVKRSEIGARNVLFSAHETTENTIRFEGDTFQIYRYSGGYTWALFTTALFRDPSAWYHIVVYYDTTQATATNRIKIYVNGEQVTAFDSSYETYPDQDSEWHIKFRKCSTHVSYIFNLGYFYP